MFSSHQPSESSQYKNRNQVNYTRFWKEHSSLSLYKSTKFLAHRDLPEILDTHLFSNNSKTSFKILDFGCGSGETAQFICGIFKTLGLNPELYGVDVNERNLAVAKENNPEGKFFLVQKNCIPDNISDFDLVICNFVLLENAQDDIKKILANIYHKLSNQGIAIVTHNTAKVYDNCNNWLSWNTNHTENARDYFDPEKIKMTREDGKCVKKTIQNTQGETLYIFHDFFYRRKFYRQAFSTAQLAICASYKPLGNDADPVTWKSEEKIPPYRIDILRKASQPNLQDQIKLNI